VARRSSKFWIGALAGIVAVGIFSRLIHTGWIIFDKYLGDSLYAAMVYAILRLFSPSRAVALWAMLAMTAIELFQLTMIPAHMLSSENLMVRTAARLMGTEFSFRDLLAYAVGIACIWLVDARRTPADSRR
jgi:hypothetical protein